MKNLNRLFTLALVLFSACNSSDSKLQFNPSKGTKVEYVYDVEQAMQQTMFGQSVSSKNLVGTTYTFEVTGEDGPSRTMSATINSFRMKMEMDGQPPMEFSTESEPPADDTVAGIMSDIFGSLKGGQFVFKINEKGEVLEVTGIDEMLDKMVSTVDVPGVPKEQLIEQVSGSFNKEIFKNSVQQSFNIFPDKQPVKVGDTWTKTMEMGMGGMTVQTENSYTLESLEAGNAKVRMTSKVLSGDTGRYEDIEYTVDGTSNGTFDLDPKTGLVTTASLVSDLDIIIKGAGIEMPAKVKQTTTVTGKLL